MTLVKSEHWLFLEYITKIFRIHEGNIEHNKAEVFVMSQRTAENTRQQKRSNLQYTWLLFRNKPTT